MWINKLAQQVSEHRNKVLFPSTTIIQRKQMGSCIACFAVGWQLSAEENSHCRQAVQTKLLFVERMHDLNRWVPPLTGIATSAAVIYWISRRKRCLEEMFLPYSPSAQLSLPKNTSPHGLAADWRGGDEMPGRGSSWNTALPITASAWWRSSPRKLCWQ